MMVALNENLNALILQVVPHLSGTKRARVEDLQRRLVAKDHTVAAALSAAVSTSPLHRPQLHTVKVGAFSQKEGIKVQ